MSKGNVDIYFAAKDRIAAGDHDGFARLLHPDVAIVADRDGWIVLTYRWSVRGSRSGVDVDAPITVAFRVKDSQLIEVHWRETRDDALEAAGLRESARSSNLVETVALHGRRQSARTESEWSVSGERESALSARLGRMIGFALAGRRGWRTRYSSIVTAVLMHAAT